MTELKIGHASPEGTPLSRPESIASGVTLPDDLPPSYSEHHESQQASAAFASSSVAEKQPQPTQSQQQAPQASRRPVDPREAGPTTSQPFHFPTNAVPAYAALDPVQKPLAIPQYQPKDTSPFLSAYPTCLLSFGITSDSWYSFVDTLSAFLNAAVGTQAIQHATDLAWTLGEAHRDWALSQQDRVYSLGRKAQKGDLFGVIGGTVGLTLGTAGHLVDSVLKFPKRLVKKPQTPRERADAYVATANKDWLNQRGLHARIVDTVQLAEVAGAEPDELAASTRQTRSVGAQFTYLYRWIAEMDIGDGKDVREKNEKVRLPITAAPPLKILPTTLWLALLKLDEEEMLLAQHADQ